MFSLIALVVIANPIDWTYNHRVQAHGTVLLGNALLGCIEAGIGEAIHRGRFVDGCGKGMVTGSVAYLGEAIGVSGGKGLGKIVFDGAISVQDNIMFGRSAFSQFQTDLGPVSLTFTNSLMPKIHTGLTAVAGLSYTLFSKNKMDWKESLSYLTPIFSFDGLRSNPSGFVYAGYTIGTFIAYDHQASNKEKESIVTHEFIHTLQWRRMLALDEMSIPWVDKLTERKATLVGRDIFGISPAMFALSNKAYSMSPFEIEAFTMEKK